MYQSELFADFGCLWFVQHESGVVARSRCDRYCKCRLLVKVVEARPSGTARVLAAAFH